MALDLKDYIGSYPDFPEKGIVFRDISPLLESGEAFHQATDEIVNFAKEKGADVIVGPEARGFIVGCPVAYSLDIGFAPARKKGKLPGKTIKETYGLEYGQASLYMHEEAIQPGQKVILTDDLMATGGTIAATKRLVEKLGGEVVGAAFIVELMNLKGRDKLGDTDILSLVKYN